MSGSLIEVRGVSKSYGGVVANKDVSIDVAEGGITGLIGPNGSGKTTLFNSIVGYHPIDEGSIKFKGWETINGDSYSVLEFFRPELYEEMQIEVEFQRALEQKPHLQEVLKDDREAQSKSTDYDEGQIATLLMRGWSYRKLQSRFQIGTKKIKEIKDNIDAGQRAEFNPNP